MQSLIKVCHTHTHVGDGLEAAVLDDVTAQLETTDSSYNFSVGLPLVSHYTMGAPTSPTLADTFLFW